MHHSSEPPQAQGGLTTASAAVDALQQLLSTGDEADRCYASRALGAIGDRTAVPALIARLDDDDIDVCIDAVTALGQIGDATAIDPLLNLLHTDPSGEVQTAVVEALGHLANDQLIEPLLELTQRRPEVLAWDEDEGWDPWWDIRRGAVTILGQLRAPQAAPVLIDILNDHESEDIEDETMRALALTGVEGEAFLVRQLKQGSPRRRRRAVRALGICGTASAWKAVLQGMRDPEPEVRAVAVRTLGSHPEIARFLQLMLVLLRDKDPGVREAVLALIAGLRIGEDQAPVAIEQLVPLLTDDSARVRAAAIDTLRRVMGERHEQGALDRVRGLLGSEDDGVAASACVFIAQYGEPQDAAPLFAVLEDTQRDARTRRAAALAVGQVADTTRDTIDQLTRVLADSSQAVRLAAVRALKNLHDRSTDGTTQAPARSRDAEQVDSTAEDNGSGAPANALEVIVGILRGDIGVLPGAQAATAPTGAQPAAGLTDAPAVSTADSETPPVEQTTDAADAVSVESELSNDNPDDAPHESAATRPGLNSTLEAIMRDNEAVAQATESAPSSESESIELAAADESLTEYADLVQSNLEQHRAGKRLTNVSVADDLRRLSARILGESDDAPAIAALIEAVSDDDPQLRRDAADSLAAIAQRGNANGALRNAYGVLVTHLFADERDVRLACVRALGRLSLASTITPLLACLDDDDVSVRTQAVYSLGELLDQPVLRDGGEPFEQSPLTAGLRQALDDAEPGVRKAAAEALAGLDHEDAVESIVQVAFCDDGGQARDVGRALRKLSNQRKVSDQLLRALDAGPDSARRRIVIEMIEEVSKPPTTHINQLSGAQEA